MVTCTVDWVLVQQCVALISHPFGNGQGITVSPRYLMTALHEGMKKAVLLLLLFLQDKKGEVMSTRNGTTKIK